MALDITVLHEPKVLAAIIQATGTIVGALIALTGLLITSKAILNRKTLKRHLLTAYNDLRVYQEVERVHVEMEIGRGNPSNLVRVRRLVSEEKGLRVSGTNAPSQVEQKVARLEGSD